ncbi:MAG: tetratricopeptide repeat protein [Phenylobacterium sp.]
MSKRGEPPFERPSTPALALERASAALQAQRLDEAERLAASVLKADRNNVGAGQVLGTALLMQGRAEEALAPLQRAARLSEHPVLETLHGRALAVVGREADALEQLRLATSRRPVLPQAFLELGDQLGALGRLDEALAVFEEGLVLAPDADVLRVGLGYLHLRRNARASARALFASVRAAAPGRRDVALGLAQVMALDGEYAPAAELFRQALAARPDDTATRIELAKCLLELGQREAGEAALRTAAAGGAVEPDGPAILALASTPHGRLFLRPSAAAKFLAAGGAG